MTSADSAAEAKTWIYASAILLLVSLWILSMRVLNSGFLALDFEISVVYLPTVIATMVAVYLTIKRRHAE